MSVDNLLNFNGVNGTQVFTDDGDSPLTFTATDATPVLDTSEKQFGSASVSFDGNGYLTSGAISIPDTWTLEGWIKLADYSGNGTRQYSFFGFRDLNNGAVSNFFGIGLSSARYFEYYDSFSRITEGKAASLDWTHIAITCDDKKIRLFVNGTQQSTQAASHVSTADFSNVSFEIMAASNSSVSEHLSGHIDAVRFTPNEILFSAVSHRDFPFSEPTTTTSPPPDPNDNFIAGEPIVLDSVDNLPIKFKFDGDFVVGTGSSEGGGPETDPTSTNIISGNVKKLGLPFGARVVVVSVGVTPEVVGSGTSDDITGDYSIDVYPYVSECLIYVAPDYGNEFTADAFVGAGQVIHPTIPNRYIYVAQAGGTVGGVEPTWPTEGQIASGGVTFDTVGLHRPLMNGFVKPVVTPI